MILALGGGAWFLTRSDANPEPKSDSTPADNGEAEVTDKDGKKESLPLVNEAPGSPSADTTNDPMTPATLPTGLCPVLVDWSSLVDCVENNNLDWYIEGVDQRASKTGFSWADIVSWAGASNVSTAEVRAIQVYGEGITDEEARSRAADLVSVEVANSLAIVRQPGCFVNTRGFGAQKMQDFVYCPPGSRQVRVSLMPAVMEGDKLVAIRDTDSGVFVDCFNLWWIPEVIETPGQPPQVVTPPPVPPTVPPPPVEPPTEQKDPSQDPYPQGNAPDGGGPNADPGPGPQTSRPTSPGPEPRVNPPAPQPNPGSGNSGTGGSKPQPDPAPPPAPQPEAPAPTTPVDPGEGSGCAPGLEC